MRKVIILVVLLAVSAAAYYLYDKNKKDDKKADPNLPPTPPPPPPPTILPPAPTPAQAEKTFTSGEGDGKYLVEKVISELNTTEINSLTYDLSLSIPDAAKSAVISSPLKSTPIKLPLSQKTETSFKRGGQGQFDQSNVFRNVDFLLSVNTDAAGALFPSLSKNNSNTFLDEFPCKVSGCKKNDKKRNEQVMSSGSLKQVFEDSVAVCNAALEANKKSKILLTTFAVEKLRAAGYKFLA